MTRRDENARKGSRGERWTQGPNAKNRTEQQKQRRAVSRRFFVVFLGLLIVFQVGFELWLAQSALFNEYLRWNASASAAMLRVLGEGASALDDRIESIRGVIAIGRGCDAIQPCAIFVAGVLAFPARVADKLWGIGIGCAVLLAMNLLRIVTLYYVKVDFPQSFQLIHEALWPAAFVLMALVLWVVWMIRLPPVARAPA
jgi:exosortase/archaeosortase family protein